MYKYADKIIEKAEKRIIVLFLKQKNILRFDEMNILVNLDALYKELDEYCRQAYLKIAQKAYKDSRKRIKALANETDEFIEFSLFNGNPINEEWVSKTLDSFDPITGYIYAHEVDRKKQRLTEEIVGQKQLGNTQPKDIIKKGMRYWTNMFRQYSIEMVDDATLQAMKDSGITKVRWVAKLDKKVCTVCKSRNNRVYDIDKVPPKEHIGCRCFLVPVI